MNNNTDILQYHIDKKLRRVQPAFAAQLKPRQLELLQKQLDLHYSLPAMRVRKARGYASLEAVLQTISEGDYEKKPPLLRYRMQFISFSLVVLLIVGSVGGYNFANQQSINTQASLVTKDPISAIDSLSSISVSDAQSDIQTASIDDSALDSAKAELSSTTNLEGSINANF